jgi:hypothetical protein
MCEIVCLFKNPFSITYGMVKTGIALGEHGQVKLSMWSKPKTPLSSTSGVGRGG